MGVRDSFEGELIREKFTVALRTTVWCCSRRFFGERASGYLNSYHAFLNTSAVYVTPWSATAVILPGQRPARPPGPYPTCESHRPPCRSNRGDS